MENNNDIRNRAFLITFPRSGKSLLDSILTSNPDIHLFNETNFFADLCGSRSIIRKVLDIPPRKHDPVYQNFLERFDFSGKFTSVTGAAMVDRRVTAFMASLDHLALLNNKSVWIEQSSVNLKWMNSIVKYIPGAKFILLIRDGEQTVLSWWKTLHTYHTSEPWRQNVGYPMEYLAKQWQDFYKIVCEWSEKPYSHVVKYEDLTTYPIETVKGICKFLDVPYSEDMLTKYTKTAIELGWNNIPWVGNVAGPIAPIKHSADSEGIPSIYKHKITDWMAPYSIQKL